MKAGVRREGKVPPIVATAERSVLSHRRHWPEKCLDNVECAVLIGKYLNFVLLRNR
jgi:hypothetical protein